MSQRVMYEAGRLAWSVLCALALAMVLMPACVAVATAQPLDVDPQAVVYDLGGVLMVWAPILAAATEWIRGFVPAWRRGTKADPAALAAVDTLRLATVGTPLAGVADAIEVVRKLAAATGGPSDLAKTVLRIVPVALGLVAGLLGAAPAVGDGSHPEVLGGIGAGLIASLFGGSLVKALRDRVGGGRIGPES